MKTSATLTDNNGNEYQQEFKIKKSYDGFPSKNKIEFTGTLQECQDHLQGLISLSRRNGAEIVSESQDHYTCDNYGNNGESVTFEIEEA